MIRPTDAMHDPGFGSWQARAVLGGVAGALLLVACGGDGRGDQPDPLSEQEAVAVANETFRCTMIDAAASGEEVDITQLEPPIRVRSGENPIRITMGIQVELTGEDVMENDPDTFYEGPGFHIAYPTLPEGSQDGIVRRDADSHVMAYVDGQMPGEREFDLTWRFVVSSSPLMEDAVLVAVPCGSGTMTVAPGGANVFEQTSAPADTSAYVVG